MKKIDIFTDGGCRGNPGVGAYAVILKYGDHTKELAAAFAKTTNNRMELLAAVMAFEALKEASIVCFYSDSKYLIDAINKNWLQGWVKNGWKNSQKQAVKNQDLWKRLLPAIAPHQIDWHWVKGHAGHEQNERCDQLVNLTIDAGIFSEDKGYDP